jgi:class 3 adenylate cyclase/PAS domain-containing protein
VRKLGVRGRLFLAFLGISAFAVLAAAAAMYAFLQVGSTLDTITQERVPAALTAQRLSRQAERVVAMAPAYLSVATLTEHEQLSGRIAAEVERLNDLLSDVKQSSVSVKYLDLIESSVERLVNNLTFLGTVVSEQLKASERKAELLGELSNTHVATQRLLAPGLRVLESNLSRLRKTFNDSTIPDEQRSRVIARTAQSIATSQPLQKAQFEESTVNDTLLRASASQLSELPILSFPLARSVNSLEALTSDMDERLRSRMADRIQEFRSFIDGPNSILRARELELEIMNTARLLLDGNTDLSRHLTDVVDRLVSAANEDIDKAKQDTRTVQQWSSGVLLAVVGLSLISSVLIVWLYVGRNLIARLTALSDSMLAIADGNLETVLPGSGDDEIGDMAKALVVFRDTAVEVKKSNLREINEARRRLSDAIESISEGFSLYDTDDQLVVSNSTYRKLLYSGIEDVVVPGASFETIIREAAERGLVADAKGRVEEWVAERLARHRRPGEPHLQHRSDGRWILISERKTEDGGTVAVYADITELKQREEELSEKSVALEQKSNALEQLSNQLAKYLSPQVYDSIFSGKQEVKVASSRKKLTIFFSDIVGFTETADRMESEELTQLINQYLTEMSQIALDHGATIDKYVGDAILIFFGDPETKGAKEDGIACVKMAIAMQKKLLDLADVWRASGIERPLRVRMGIHSGYCTVGNFGSEDRLDYTIIGAAVNTASRLESLAAPGEILISYETFAHVKELIRCEEHGETEVKGIAYPVATYRVIDTYENLGRERRHFREEHSNVKLDIDLEAMTGDDRRPAADILRRALTLLTEDDKFEPQSEALKK